MGISLSSEPIIAKTDAMQMNSALARFVAVVILFTAGAGLAQDAGKAAGDGEPAAAAQGDLEAKFIITLTAATLSGHSSFVKDGKLTAEKEDSYNITSVEKRSEDNWIINAHIRYGQNNYDIPVPAQVKWAGDTAVLVLDKISLGGPRSYSARVMIYNNTYSGIWTAGDHGGVVSGVITH